MTMILQVQEGMDGRLRRTNLSMTGWMVPQLQWQSWTFWHVVAVARVSRQTVFAYRMDLSVQTCANTQRIV